MCSVHDTIELEKRGIPTAVVITSVFEKAADFQFRGKGMEEHPYIVLPHPVSHIEPEEMRNITLRYVDEVLKHLTS